MHPPVDLLAENIRLREQITEAEAMLAAVHRGEVDALVVGSGADKRVFTLEGAETPYRMFVEAMAEGAATVEADGRILYANAALARLLKLPLAKLMHARMADVVMPGEGDALAGLLGAASTGALHRETRLRASDGTAIPARIAAAPLTHASGTPKLALIVADLTERDQAEAQLRSWNVDLEARVAQRTAELSRLNAELQSFSSSVAHDLRTPLRAIDGFACVLAEDCADILDEDGRDALDRIRAAAQHMGQVIDALLDLARLSRSDLHFETVNLADLARDITHRLAAADPDRHVRFEIPASIKAWGDPALLRVAMTNLLENAWKFTGRRASASIEFGQEEGNGEAVFFVRDNGAGFDFNHVDSLFKPFSRLHTAAEFPGTGIGLTTVQRIVERHGGRVWAEGGVDQGATFSFSLPAHAPVGAEAAIA